jgi:hypothetical protein
LIGSDWRANEEGKRKNEESTVPAIFHRHSSTLARLRSYLGPPISRFFGLTRFD